MRIVIAVLCGVALIGATPAATSVYRCTGSAGEVTYSQTACGDHATTIEARPAQAIGDGLRPAEKAWLKARARRLDAAPGARPRTSSQAGLDRVAPAADRQAYRCRRTRQQLDALHAEMRRGYKAGRGAKLRERRTRYETYLASFCS